MAKVPDARSGGSGLLQVAPAAKAPDALSSSGVAAVGAVVSSGPSADASAPARTRRQKYPSINDADLVQVDKIHKSVQGTDVEFVAVEKVHGSNFAFEFDGRSIEYFSRNRRLEKEERFVGKTAPGEAMRRYHEAVREAFRLCSESVSGGVDSVVVYGEYFGGWYPNVGLQCKEPGAGAPVQKDVVAYAPAHHFLAFDLAVDGAYMDFDKARDVLTRAGFPLVAAPLTRGSFEECMAFNVESLCTTIPGLLGLPPCEAFSIAEGVIVKPVRHCEKWTVKRKSLRYLEACPDELRKWATKCVESKEQVVEDLYLCLCRQPRLDAVLSKEPQLRAKLPASLPRVQALFREDTEGELEKKLATLRAPLPQICLEKVRAEADRRVAAWLLPSVGEN